MQKLLGWGLAGLMLAIGTGCGEARTAPPSETAEPSETPSMTLAETPIPGPRLSTSSASALRSSYANAVKKMEPDRAAGFRDDLRLVALWGYTVGIDPDDPLPMEEVDISVLRMLTGDEGRWFDEAFAAETDEGLDEWIEMGANRLDGMSVGEIRREAGELRRIAEGKWREELTNQFQRAKEMEGRFAAQIAALRVTTPDEEERAKKRKTCEISLSNFSKDREDLAASLESLDRKDYDAAKWVGLSPKKDCWVY